MLVVTMEAICCDDPDPVVVHGPRYSSLYCARCESDLTTSNANVELAERDEPRGNVKLGNRYVD